MPLSNHAIIVLVPNWSFAIGYVSFISNRVAVLVYVLARACSLSWRHVSTLFECMAFLTQAITELLFLYHRYVFLNVKDNSQRTAGGQGKTLRLWSLLGFLSENGGVGGIAVLEDEMLVHSIDEETGLLVNPGVKKLKWVWRHTWRYAVHLQASGFLPVRFVFCTHFSIHVCQSMFSCQTSFASSSPYLTCSDSYWMHQTSSWRSSVGGFSLNALNVSMTTYFSFLPIRP